MPNKFTKAFLLAAGLGTRLRPLTNQVPKCLVPINDRPLLSIWLDICERLGVEEVLINTHHLAEQVQAWAQRVNTSVTIHLFHEQTLLGSAATVAANRDFVRNSENFYVFYADNLVCADLKALRSFHEVHQGVLTLGLFRAGNPRACGIVTLDESGCVTSFEEKPVVPRSNYANSGIYIARQQIFSYLEDLESGRPADFGRDVMPRLVGKMYGRLLDGYLLDIGTPENYQRAQQEWPGIVAADPESTADR